MIDPYFTDGTVTLYLSDCREVLPALGVTADLIVADPPYGETALAWDRWPEGWLDVAAQFSQSLWCFGSMRSFGEHWQEFCEAGWKPSQDVIGHDEDGTAVFGDVHTVWEKHAGSGFATDRFKRVHEHVQHWYQGQWSAIHHDVPRVPATRPRGGQRFARPQLAHTGRIGNDGGYRDDGTRLMRSVVKVQSVRGKRRHPSEKPLGLLQPLIRYACPPGGLVVDPFAGSGSTLDAARQSGRRAIGIEGHEPYAEKAARRLEQTTLEAS